MGPVRRPEGEPPPLYTLRSNKFSAEFNHGGYFVGQGRDRSYVNGRSLWFDQLDKVTWSTIMLESIVEEIGWEMAGRVKAYYRVPILKIENNGLRALGTEEDVDRMMQFLPIGHHFFSIYLDHDDIFLQRNDEDTNDDVVHIRRAHIPPVRSPCKPTEVQQTQPGQKEDADQGHHVDQGERGDQGEHEADSHEHVLIEPTQEDASHGRSIRKHSTVHVLDEKDGDLEDSSDSDYQPDSIMDSDNEVEEDDDDLYEQNVDKAEAVPTKTTKSSKSADHKWKKKATDEKGKQEAKDAEDDVSEGEDLWAPDSDDEAGMMKFKTFREDDLHCPQFHVGQVFDTVELVRKAVKEYSCQNRVDLTMPINDRRRVKVICVVDCTWYLWVSYDSRTKSFMVKTFVGEHTCAKKWELRAFTSKFLAHKYLDSFRADQNMSLQNFSRIVQKEWHMTLGRMKLQRARRYAMEIIYGDEEGQYKILWDYATEVRRSNPGSSFYVSLDGEGRFSKLYMCLDATKRGFLQGCRPVIFIDGCHIKTRYRGQLLAAVGMDPNDCIFPIAIAVVEVEDTTNWLWFLDTLKRDLGIVNTAPWTIMSDKQKGLINAVSELFPDAEHRFCVRHMWSNFQQQFKGDVLKNQLWKIARSNTVIKFEQYMEEMKIINPDAHKWLAELEPNTWVRAFQSDLPKCDILLNNNCEVFNKYILDAREIPILSMVQTIKGQLMKRHYTKLLECEKWPGEICPKIRKKVEKATELANLAQVSGAGDGLFHVADRGTDYVVELHKKTCTCRRFQKSGIPCVHVISCCRSERIDPLSLVDPCYSKTMFRKAYGNII